MKNAIVALLLSTCAMCAAQESPAAIDQKIQLPSSQVLFTPAPGSPRRTNSLPTAAAVSPDQRYVALLNAGYGTGESHLGQSITLLDRTDNQLTDFADERLRPRFKQTYFFGLAFSTSGDELYASVASFSDSEAESAGDTGSGVAVYSFHDGKLKPSRFLKIPPQTLPEGKKFLSKSLLAKGRMIAYPAGLAVLPASGDAPERLLVAGNLSDQVWLLDANSGAILETFDVSDSHSEWIPSTMPYAIASDGGQRAWVSLGIPQPLPS